MKIKDLSPEHVEQIKSMSKDGKSDGDIIRFFKDSYQIELLYPQIDRICLGTKRTEVSRKFKKKVGNQGNGQCQLKSICRFTEVCQPEVCRYII